MNSFCGRRRDFWLVFVARARGTQEGKRKPTLLFSPPVCVRARPRNLALRLKKIRLRSPGGGGCLLRILSVFQRACSQASKTVEKQ